MNKINEDKNVKESSMLNKTYKIVPLIIVSAIMLGSHTPLVGLARAKIDSDNYSIVGDTLDNGGGLATTTSSNYDALESMGVPFSGDYESTTFTAELGFNEALISPRPHQPTLVNDGNYYNKLKFKVNTEDGTNNPSDTKYAVAITSATDWSVPASIKFVQDSYAIGGTLGIEDFMTYAEWGTTAGIFITGLDPDTTYRVRVTTLHGDYTGTDWSVEATADTILPYISFSLNNTNMEFGVLNPASISTVSPTTTATIGTNVEQGYTMKVSSEGNGASPGLYSDQEDNLIASETATLSAGAEGYGIQASSVSATIAATYDKTGNNVGGLLYTLTTMASNTAPVTSEEVTVTAKAAISTLTEGGNYSDTITYFVSTNL